MRWWIRHARDAFSQVSAIGQIQRQKRTLVELQQLEERSTPVVGSLANATLVNRGDGYDGVVRIDGGGVGTGSLVYTGRHILTAAHVADGKTARTVTFQMKRGATDFDIAIPIPVNTGKNIYQIPHPSYTGLVGGGYDLSILTLTDPVETAPNRHLVAPFGAERYDLYADGKELGVGGKAGLAFTMVGYGREGKGETGAVVPPVGRPKRSGENTFDVDSHVYRNEIQSIQIENSKGGSFTLTYAGVTTAAIAFDANAGKIQAELEAAKDAKMATPLAGSVRVRGGATSKDIFFVEFMGGKAATNVA